MICTAHADMDGILGCLCMKNAERRGEQTSKVGKHVPSRASQLRSTATSSGTRTIEHGTLFQMQCDCVHATWKFGVLFEVPHG